MMSAVRGGFHPCPFLIPAEARQLSRCQVSKRSPRRPGLQLVQKLSALEPAFGRISPMNPVGQLGDGQRADDDRHLADCRTNVLDYSGVVRLARSLATRVLESRTKLTLDRADRPSA